MTVASSNTLLCLVCGFAHGGTTMLGELLRQHPRVDGRFEAGLLLGERPKDFTGVQCFPRFVRRCWGVDDGGMRRLTSCQTFPEMYDTLREVSNLEDKTVQIYDKAPVYMYELAKIMAKTDVPVVVTVKDPRAILLSNLRRHATAPLEKTALSLDPWTRGYEHAQRTYGDRILLVRNEHLCLEPLKYGKQIYDFLGLEWKDEYVELRSVYPLHDNIYGNEDGGGSSRGIASDRLTEWKELLPAEDVEIFQGLLQDSRRWCWNP